MPEFTNFSSPGSTILVSALRAVLEAARHHCAAENVTRALSPIVPASLHSMLEISLYRPDRAATVSQLADSAGVTRGTIFNRCKQAWSIGPEEFLTLGPPGTRRSFS